MSTPRDPAAGDRGRRGPDPSPAGSRDGGSRRPGEPVDGRIRPTADGPGARRQPPPPAQGAGQWVGGPPAQQPGVRQPPGPGRPPQPGQIRGPGAGAPGGQLPRRPVPPGAVRTPLPVDSTSRDQPPAADRPASRAWAEIDGQRPATRMMAASPPPAGGGPRDPGGPRGPVWVGPDDGSGGGSDDGGSHRTPGGILASRIVATIAAVAVLLVTGIVYFINQGGTSQAQRNADQVAKIPGGGITILLIGSDSRSHADGSPLTADELRQVSTTESAGTNTDTLMLLHLPADGAQATAVSIPRDTWIDESVTSTVKGPYSDGSTGEYKPNKINAFYGTAKTYSAQYLTSQGVTGAERERRSSEAGRQMLISVVSKFTGMYIDHFAEVNLIAFYTISTALQGVPVCLKAAVNDSFSGANFPAGLQNVQGTSALAFVRQRHGLPGGDLDRVRRQQAFLSGAIKKVLSSPTTIPALADAAQKSLVMDTGLDLLTLGDQMQALSGGKVAFQTLPTHGNAAATGTDALATDPAEVKAFFAKIRGKDGAAGRTSASSSASRSSTNQAVTVDVQNGTMTAGLGKSVATLLQGKGMTVSTPGDMPGKSQSNQLDSTQVRYPAGAQASADAVVGALGFGTATQSDDVSAGHVLVVVGKDAPAPSGLRDAVPAFAAPSSSGGVPDSVDGVPCIN